MKILFICTHNRCRSILGEAITNHYGQNLIEAKSAGSQPVGQVHPLSIKYLKAKGILTENLRSQSWDEHENFSPDVVITVCDSAAAEQCPLWFGKSVRVHWGLSDPSKLDGSEEEIEAAFYACIDKITVRIKKITDLNINNLKPEALKQALEQIAESD